MCLLLLLESLELFLQQDVEGHVVVVGDVGVRHWLQRLPLILGVNQFLHFLNGSLVRMLVLVILP